MMLFLVQTGFHHDESFVEGVYLTLKAAFQVAKEQLYAGGGMDYGVVTMFEPSSKTDQKQDGMILGRWERVYNAETGKEELKEVELYVLTDAARIIRKAIEIQEGGSLDAVITDMLPEEG